MNGNSRLEPPRSGSNERYMNGSGYAGNGNDRSYASSMASPSGLGGKTMLDNYRQDLTNGFESDTPKYNPVSDAHDQR